MASPELCVFMKSWCDVWLLLGTIKSEASQATFVECCPEEKLVVLGQEYPELISQCGLVGPSQGAEVRSWSDQALRNTLGEGSGTIEKRLEHGFAI